MIGMCRLLSSGPVSFVRYVLRHRHAAQIKAQAEMETLQEVASGPQDGVRPPPPNYRP